MIELHDQMFVSSNPHGTNALKVCESEMVMVKDLFFENLLLNSVITTKKKQKIANININDQF